MRKVLMIAYEYPPRGWSGVLRTVKFVRYLPVFGWEPVLLTPREWFLPGVMDPSLMPEVAQATVERTGMLTQADLMRFWKSMGCVLSPILRCFGKDVDWFAQAMRWRCVRWLFPDYAAGWVLPAVLQGLKMVRRHRPTVIYATAPPYSDLLIGSVLSWATGLPLVADFRDLWVDNFDRGPVGRRWDRAERRLERWVVSRAARVVSTTRTGTARLAARYTDLPAEKFATVFNGYDRKDMPNAAPARPNRTRMTICHVGSLYGTRTPAPFLRAVESLREENPSLQEQVRVRFVGDVRDFVPLLIGSACADMIEVVGPVSHERATRELASADVLLLIMEPGADMVIPGKIFEYMISGKPILAAVPLGGEAANLLRQAGGATVVGVEDVDGIKQALADLRRRWLRGALAGGRDEAFLRGFERRELTRQLAGIFVECDCDPRGGGSPRSSPDVNEVKERSVESA